MKRISYYDLMSKVAPAHSALRAAEANRLFATRPRRGRNELAPSVRELAEFVERPKNGFLRIYIGHMLDEANRKSSLDIKTSADFFQQLDNALHSYPRYDSNFMAALPFYMILQPFMETDSGWIFFTNEEVRPYFANILKAYHDNLNTPDSLACVTQAYGNWLSKEACEYLNMDEYVYDPSDPHGGFKSWNEFFIRKFKDIRASRPCAPDPTGKRVISPADGQVWKISRQVHRKAAFEIKDEQYYLTDLLAESAHSELLEPFVDGLAVQIVLMPFNYHRWHSPVSGTIKRVKQVPGEFFAQPAPNQDYAESFQFLSHVNTRTIMIFEPANPNIGSLALIFVGLTEVSSCNPTIQEGARVERGDEIGHFAFGGSTCCILFERGKIASLDITDQTTPSGDASGSTDTPKNVVLVRQNIATAL